MPKASLIVAAALALVGSLHAQSHLSVLAGFSSSTVSAANGDTGPLRLARTGLVRGVAGSIGILGHVSLSPEVLYVHKGFTRTHEGITFALDIRYIEVPVLLSSTYREGPANVVVFAGPSFSFRAACTASDSGSGGRTTNDCVHTDAGAIVPASDLSLMGGFGVAVGRWSLTGRYDLGHNHIPANTPGLALQNRTVSLMVGFRIAGGRPRG